MRTRYAVRSGSAAPLAALAFAFLATSCSKSPRAEERAVAPTQDEIQRSLRHHFGAAELVLDFTLAVPSSRGGITNLVAVGSDTSHRFAAIFTPDRAARWSLRLDRPEKHWMAPQQPLSGDLDGDGQHEIVLPFVCLLADRSSQTVLVLAERDGSWQLREPPALLATLREHAPEETLYQDDRLETVERDGKALWFHGLHGGGGWSLVASSDGEGSALLGLGTVPNRPHRLGPQRYFLALYRMNQTGYTLDAGWNEGGPLLTREPVPFSEFDLEREVAQRFAKR